MTKNINYELHRECVLRIERLDANTVDDRGPLRDLVSILRLFDERLQELERKK